MNNRKQFLSICLSGLLLTCIFISSCTSKEAKETPETKSEPVLTSSDPLETLKMGNARFVSGNLTFYHEDSARVAELKAGQQPMAIVVSCSDSRVAPEIVFDQGLGDIFTIRTAGNVMGDYEVGSIEYAAEHCKSKLIVVMGHTSCGAIGALLEHANDNNVPGHIAAIVKYMKEEKEEQEALHTGGDSIAFNAVRANVEHGVMQLRKSEPILKELYDKKEVNIVGAIYHLETGKVEFMEF